jgi:hypothetical protein
MVSAQVHVSALGSCTVNAMQGGNSTYQPAVTVTRSFNVVKANQAIDFPQPAARAYGGADFAVAATASSGLAVNVSASGVCSIVSGQVHVSSAGSCSLTASQPGDGRYLAATDVARVVTISQAPTTVSAVTVTIDSANPTAQFSDTLRVQASVSAAATTNGDGSFAGNLIFRVNGMPTAGLVVPVSKASPAGSATLRLEEGVIPGSGTYPVTAEFVPASGSNYGGSTNPVQTLVVKGEGQSSTGTRDGSMKLEYAGPTSVAAGTASALVVRIRQGLSPELKDTQFVDYLKSMVQVAASIYAGSCTTSCTPVWGPVAVRLNNNTDWSTTGTGIASMAGPQTLPAGTYRLQLALSSYNRVGADPITTSFTVTSATGFVGADPGNDGTRTVALVLIALLGIGAAAIYVRRRQLAGQRVRSQGR